MPALARLLRGLMRGPGRHRADPKADPAILARIGSEVRDRLLADPRAVARGGDKADLFLVPGLLRARECARLIRVIESRIGPSVLFSDRASPAGRTSSTHYFAEQSPETRALGRLLDDVLGIERRHAETIQGQRYRVGEEYRHHCDFFREDRAHWQGERPRGGQRTWSAMVYLNAVEAGGETEFPELGLRIVPEPGLLVAWNNMDRKGRPNRATRHAALPVARGKKYVITQWYRQDDWSLHRH